MGVRRKYLQQIRDYLEETNRKASERVADLAVSISEKADEEDVRDVMKTLMEAVEFIPSLSIFAMNLTVDKRVPIGEKIKIGLLTAFLIAPAEVLLMELIGPIAFMDDIVIVAYLIYSIASLISSLDEEVIQDNWVGNPEHVQQFVDAARSVAGMVGPGRIQALEKFD